MNIHLWLFSILLIVATLATPLSAETTTLIRLSLDDILEHGFSSEISEGVRPRVGLALSGGGARGLAQIGVLKEFELRGLKIDLVAGTSMGGIIGGLWAAGYTADSIEQMTRSVEWDGFFSDKPRRSSLFLTQREHGERHLLAIRFDGFKPTIPTALTGGQKLNSLLTKLALEPNYRSQHDFDRLSIPLRICAVDILTAESVVLKEGNLADALRATMSVPLAFTPLEIDSMMLMDGGLLTPIPVEVAISAGCDFVIAVNTASDLLSRDQITNAIDIANQTTTIMQLEARRRELSQADVVIVPELEDHLATDFDNIDQLIELGRKAAVQTMPLIMESLGSSHGNETTDDLLCVDSIIVPPELSSHPSVIALRSYLSNHGELNSSDVRMASVQIMRGGALQSLAIRIIDTAGISVLQFDPQPIDSPLEFGWKGNETLPDHVIAEVLSDTNRTEDLTERVQQTKDRILSVYREHGYDLAEIDSVRFDGSRSRLIFHINEGLTGKVWVVGNDRTRGWVIRRNFALETGDPFNLEAAQKGISNIFSTGLFERVNLNVTRRDKRASVKIEVKERISNLIRLGGHYHEHYHAETFVDFVDANVLGYSHELFVRVQYGEKRKSYSFHLKADRIFETYLTYHLNLYHDRLKRDRYTDNKSFGFNRERHTGATFAFGQQIARLGIVTLEAKASRVRIDLPAFSGLEHRNFRSVTLRSRLDNLDKYPFPRIGVASHFYLEYAFDAFGGENRYKKAYFDWRAQIPVIGQIGLQPAFAIGVSDIELPEWEKFYMGGNRTFYGYFNDALDGDKMFRANIGIRYGLPYRFYVTGRYDTGNVWSTLEEIMFRNLRHAFGIELAYDSPIGPISISYGRSDDKHDRFYIDVGHDF
jgi:NTE family protein